MHTVYQPVYVGLFFLLLLIAAATAFPWNLSRPRSHVILTLPLFGLLAFGLYELAMRSAIPSTSVPIRLDLVVIVPAVVFFCWMGIVRLVVFCYLRLAGSSRTGRLEQAGGLVISVIVVYVLSALILK